MKAEGYVVIDLETTGFSPQNDRAVEIAAILLSPDFRVDGWWTTLLNPLQDIGATHIHGISVADVADAPSFPSVASMLVKQLQERTMVAHNARFEVGFLEEELRRCGLPMEIRNKHCTMEHARRLAIKPATLDACCRKFGILNPAPHSALGDAAVTMQLFKQLNHGDASVDRGDDSLRSLLATSAFVGSRDQQNALRPRCSWLQ